MDSNESSLYYDMYGLEIGYIIILLLNNLFTFCDLLDNVSNWRERDVGPW